jgi:hypothetical protein
MHARPPSCWGPPNGFVLQSSKVEHGPHVPLMHACPFWHPNGPPCPQPTPPLGVHIPVEHDSLGAQSVSVVHVHCMPMCVGPQTALGPHCTFEEQVWHALPTQTWPGLHCQLAMQVAQPPWHSVQMSIGVQPPVSQ